MELTDSIRRNGYVIATIIGLIAIFVLLTGNAWTAIGLALFAATLIGLVERIAEIQQRHFRRHSPNLGFPLG
jgi:hypothetical protein